MGQIANKMFVESVYKLKNKVEKLIKDNKDVKSDKDDRKIEGNNKKL